MAEQRQIVSGLVCGRCASTPRGLLCLNRASRGFTLIELFVVLFLVGVMALFSAWGYRQGLLREYRQTAQIRALVNALHLAQWRALKGGTAIPIKSSSSQDLSGGWYRRVEIETQFAHNFKVGDWVGFSDIASLPPGPFGHSDLNFGRHMVVDVEASPAPTKFQVSAYGVDDAAINDIPQSPPYPAPVPVPMVRNATGAAKLVLIKMSKIKELLADPGIAQNATKITADPQNFVYDDRWTFIWGYADGGYASPEESGVETDSDYTVTLRFDSRGLPADPNGYQLAVGSSPSAKTGTIPPSKIITITPTGKIVPGGG